MSNQAILLIIILVVFCVFIAWGGCRKKGDIEAFRRHHRRGGWGGWGGLSWPYYAGFYTGWPPYLYGYNRPQYRGPRCITSNEVSDCDPFYPVKVGTDTDSDGTKDSWQCCRRY